MASGPEAGCPEPDSGLKVGFAPAAVNGLKAVDKGPKADSSGRREPARRAQRRPATDRALYGARDRKADSSGRMERGRKAGRRPPTDHDRQTACGPKDPAAKAAAEAHVNRQSRQSHSKPEEPVDDRISRSTDV